MGSGKSSLGKWLAEETGLAFVDTDLLFEEKYKISIPSFFNQFDENLFRQFEKQILENTFQMNNCIISTGGGMPCYADNIEVMKKNGYCIYLKYSPETLSKRISKNLHRRPILKGIDKNDITGFITQHLKKRETFYLQADFIAHEPFSREEILKVVLKEIQ